MERNAFQRLMAHWDELQPYNALSIVALRRPVDCQRLRQAAESVFQSAGLGAAQIEPGGRRFSFQASPGPVEVQVFESGKPHAPNRITEVATETRPREQLAERAAKAQALEQFALSITKAQARERLAQLAAGQLNRAFEPSDWPVRYFVLTTDNRHYVGQVYHHWIGDEYAMHHLLGQVLAKYLGANSSAPADWRTAMNGACRTVLRRQARALDWIGHAATSIRELVRMRSSFCPAHGPATDGAVDVAFPELAGDTLDRLQRYARREDVTVNDVLLTVLFEAIAGQTTAERATGRRRELAITSIVSMRPWAEEWSAPAGLHLSYFNTICGPKDLADRRSLLSSVSRQNRRNKERKSALAGLLEMEFSNRIWPWVHPNERARYFARQKPVAAGMTNFRAVGDWPVAAAGVEHVARAACGGPMTPLAVAVTTAQGCFNVGMVSGRNGYRPDQIQAITQQFVDRLSRL